MNTQEYNAMPQIFISHSNKDYHFIKNELKLPEFLRRYNFKPWLSEEDIPIGKTWREVIDQALEGSNWYIVAMSSGCVESEGVKYEVNWIFDNNREDKIIPILIGECNPDDIRKGLNQIQYRDFSHNPKDAQKFLLKRLGIDLDSLDQQKKIIREEIERVFRTEDKLINIFSENEQTFGKNFYNQIPGNDFRTRIVYVIIELINRQLMNVFIEVVRQEYTNFAQDL